MLYVISALVSFSGVFLRVFQQKNVVGNHVRTAMATSYAIALTDFASVLIIVHGGWWVVLTSGTGAAIGVLLAMKTHDKIFARPEVRNDK